jgi:hypothetical protein
MSPRTKGRRICGALEECRRSPSSQSQRQWVEAMPGCGAPEPDVAILIDIAPKTLRKHFRDEFETGHIKASAKVAGNLYRIATGSGREAVTARYSG